MRIRSGEAKTVSATNGWYAVTPEMEANRAARRRIRSLNPGADGYTLTSDGNIIHVRGTMTYRITDPVTYTFGFTNVTDLLANTLNNAICRTSAGYTADAAVCTRTSRDSGVRSAPSSRAAVGTEPVWSHDGSADGGGGGTRLRQGGL